MKPKIKGTYEVVVWRIGTPLREFLHVDDLANSAVFLLKEYDDGGIVNFGTGSDISIADVALLFKQVVGYQGDIVYDTTKPDGVPKKLLDCTKLHNLGWRSSIPLREGLALASQLFLDNQDGFRQ